MKTDNQHPPVRLVICDDHEWVRAGLRSVLHCPPDLLVVDTPGSPSDTFRVVEAQRPDVVLLDYMLGGTNGLALAESMSAFFPPARILLLSAWEDANVWQQARKIGIGGFLLKKADDDMLRQAVRSVAAGRPVFHEGLGASSDQSLQDRWQSLTQTEWAVLRALKVAGSPKQAALQMGPAYSAKTISNHLQSIYRKLGRNGFRVVTELYTSEGYLHDPVNR